MKVLLTTDGSKHAFTAAASACRILASAGREADLMCIVPAPSEKLHRRAKRILETAKRALAAEGASVQTAIRSGSPARTLIAASAGYDVVVVGALSHSSGSMAGLGPVASRVVEHATSSVLVGREMPNTAGLRILAPVDGSDGSLEALDRMAQWIDLSGAEVTLVHVVETPWLHAGPDQEWLGYEEEMEEAVDPQAQFEREFESEGEAILERARARLPVRTTVSTLLYDGLPAAEILSEADRGDYNLVVLSASGVKDLKHEMLGSVSSKVAWSAPCPVLLVRG